MHTKFLFRHCPGCASHKSPTPEMSAPVRAENTSFEKLIPCWNGVFKDAPTFFTYSRCVECGLLFNPTFFNEEQLGILYGQMPPNMDSVPKDSLRKTQRGYFEILKKFDPLTGVFMEIGPDVGFFAENCAREGHYDKFLFFEPNRDVAEELSKVTVGKSYEIIHDMFNFDTVQDHSVSSVVMIHVFDHLLDPVETLMRLRKKLTSNAKVLIVTHNESSLLRKVLKAKWAPFCLQHPQIYNRASIEIVLEKAGFKVLHQQDTINYFPISFLAKNLLWAFGLKIRNIPSLGNIALGLRLGNIATVAMMKAKDD